MYLPLRVEKCVSDSEEKVSLFLLINFIFSVKTKNSRVLAPFSLFRSNPRESQATFRLQEGGLIIISETLSGAVFHEEY